MRVLLLQGIVDSHSVWTNIRGSAQALSRANIRTAVRFTASGALPVAEESAQLWNRRELAWGRLRCRTLRAPALCPSLPAADTRLRRPHLKGLPRGHRRYEGHKIVAHRLPVVPAVRRNVPCKAGRILLGAMDFAKFRLARY